MRLNQEMQAQGQWLFRWRSYLPILFIFLIGPAFLSFHYPFGSHAYDLLWEICCMMIGFFGLTIRALTIGYAPRNTSGRNTKEQIADALNTKGMYSLIRNPLYLGNFFMWLAPVLFLHHFWLCMVFALVFALYYERIVTKEEAFLSDKFGDLYMNWASQTPAFFPKHLRWQQPGLPFSWKTVIRREYHGFYGLVAVMTTMEHISEFMVNQAFVIDAVWAWIFIVSTGVYLFIRFLAKYTNVLSVAGR